MALGLERALADYISAQLGYGLYDHADPAQRVLFLVMQPPVPVLEAPPADAGETTAALAVTVFPDGGPAPQSVMAETYTVTVQVRHPQYEVATAEARRVHDLLHENGGMGVRPGRQGRFGQVRVATIRADFPATFIGRDDASRGGRAITSQSFTVRCLAPVVFA